MEAKLNTGPTPCYFKLSKVRRPVTTEKEGKKTNSQEQKDKSLKFVSRRPVIANLTVRATNTSISSCVSPRRKNPPFSFSRFHLP